MPSLNKTKSIVIRVELLGTIDKFVIYDVNSYFQMGDWWKFIKVNGDVVTVKACNIIIIEEITYVAPEPS